MKGFIREFDANMYPKESAAFSVAPRRDGSKAVLDNMINDKTASKNKDEARVPSSYYLGDGAKTVTLVDNVRDANFYDPTDPDGKTYIAGFFYSVFNEYVDRNVMTIDSYDWLHRTGANPRDDSTNPEYVACAKKIEALALGRSNPYLYEGVFAHEYQHLLEYYADLDEVRSGERGPLGCARTLTKSGDWTPSYLPTSRWPTAHRSASMGYVIKRTEANAFPYPGGPENSLTLWGDQTDDESEILCDYGAAWHVHGLPRAAVRRELPVEAAHEQEERSRRVADLLDRFAGRVDAMTVLDRWAGDGRDRRLPRPTAPTSWG